MIRYDVFNGDADGIIGLLQLRLADPRETILVTGVKREIRLLERIEPAQGDEITVLDISLDENREALHRALDAGARCRYFDHHYAGEIPAHPRLEAHIDTSAELCTSLIVDRHIGGRFRAWAVAAAFGDNLIEPARRAAEPLGLRSEEVALLKELGEAINYNAYGESVADLHYDPADLFRNMLAYADPFEFIIDEPVLETLKHARADDLARAAAVAPQLEAPGYALYRLPDAAWSRRVSGTFANAKAQEFPTRAHAIIVSLSDGTLSANVRAPLARPYGAAQLCRRFPSGGGREAAAGINRLREADLAELAHQLEAAYGSSAKA